MSPEERKNVDALVGQAVEARIDITILLATVTRLARVTKALAYACGKDDVWIETVLGEPITIDGASLAKYPWLAQGDRHLEKDALELLDPAPRPAG
jgi:hypothetical protein